MAENRISASLSAEDVQAIRAALASIKEKLPFLVDLTPEESKSLPRLGDKSRAFVAKALEVAQSNPSILPGYFDVEEMRQDLELFETLYPLMMQFAQVAELLSDTVALAGSEAYAAARLVYAFAKASNLGEGMEPLLEDMGKRFKRSRATKTPTTT